MYAVVFLIFRVCWGGGGGGDLDTRVIYLFIYSIVLIYVGYMSN